MEASIIIDEIRTLARELKRQPTMREWVHRYKHCDKRCTPHGGFALLAREAMSQVGDLDMPSAFTIPTLPEGELPPEQLIDRMCEDFRRRHAANEARKLIPVSVTMDGPIAIAFFGDPHIDDNGCDWPTLRTCIDTVRSTEGMFAGNVGDISNNWCPRLARLYGDQDISARNAWRLVDWFISQLRWLFLVGGNHDAWSGEGNPIKWMMGLHNASYGESAVRMNLVFPNGREVRINARHDFAGHSQWNPAHGSAKAAQMGWRDNVLVCGHRHTSGYNILKDPRTGLLSHCIQVPSFEVDSRFGIEKGFPDQCISPCPAIVIDPYAQDEVGLIQFFLSAQRAAWVLSHMRAEWKSGRKAKKS